ncbi:MAG: ATP-binding cassette domain-containing protein [Chlamydiia bacterium]|nr:ATP-binding cassette domain-containing protein [Chlamydiia bacterium]
MPFANLGIVVKNGRVDPSRLEEEMDRICFQAKVHWRRVRLTKEVSLPTMVFDKALTTAMVIQPGQPIPDHLHRYGYTFYSRFFNKPFERFSLMLFALKGKGKELFALAALTLLAAAIGLVSPVVNRWLFDVVIPTQAYPLFWALFASLAAVLVASTLFQTVRAYVTLNLGGIIANQVNGAVWDRLFSIQMKALRGYSAGLLSERMALLEALRSALTTQTLGILFSGFFSLVYLVPLFYYSVSLAFYSLLSIALILTISVWGILKKVPLQMDLFDRQSKLQGFLVQLVQGIGKIRLMHAEERVYREWEQVFLTIQERVRQLMQIDNGVTLVALCVPLMNLALILLIAATLVQEGTLTVGTFIAFQTAFAAFSTALISSVTTAMHLVAIVPVWRRCQEIMDKPLEKEACPIVLPSIRGDLEIKAISFRYQPEQRSILDQFSLIFKQGEWVCLSGASGCGKSTLLRLILGLEEVDEGEILFDGIPQKDYYLPALRRQIGAVLQNTEILSGSVEDNILVGRPYDAEEMCECLRISHFDRVLQGLPLGPSTPLPSGGESLSGGERQRLLLARSLYQRPKLLLLDEATRGLDERLQETIFEEIKKIPLTCIYIAHRENLTKYADKVVFMG